MSERMDPNTKTKVDPKPNGYTNEHDCLYLITYYHRFGAVLTAFALLSMGISNKPLIFNGDHPQNNIITVLGLYSQIFFLKNLYFTV